MIITVMDFLTQANKSSELNNKIGRLPLERHIEAFSDATPLSAGSYKTVK